MTGTTNVASPQAMAAVLRGSRGADEELSAPYARAIDASCRVRWDIEFDVLDGRSFDFAHTFMPDALACIEAFAGLSHGERRLISQIQARTYAYVVGLFDRCIGVKMLQLSSRHWYGDPVAREALVRCSDGARKHQKLFRRVRAMIAADMPPGYGTAADPNDFARTALARSSWALLALATVVAQTSQAHWQQAMSMDPRTSPLWTDILRFHWMEERQHAALAELEWGHEDDRLSDSQRDAAVDDLIALLGAIDRILQAQATADADYFAAICLWQTGTPELDAVRSSLLMAYRQQHVESGFRHARVEQFLGSLLTTSQRDRIRSALAPLLATGE